MKLGVHIVGFDFPGGAAAIGAALARAGEAAEQAGIDNLSVMDHYLQIAGDADGPMLEGYTTLGYLAAHTSTVELQLLVTGVSYGTPGCLPRPYRPWTCYPAVVRSSGWEPPGTSASMLHWAYRSRR